MDKRRSIINVAVVATGFFSIVLACFLAKESDFSLSEKRKLATKPVISAESLLNRRFMKDFESYTQDQFPFREGFRKLAALYSCYLAGRTDNHDIFVVDQKAYKLDYKLNDLTIINNTHKFEYVYDQYIKDTKDRVFFSIIYDKNYYLDANLGYPRLDYEKLTGLCRESMPFAEYIDISDTLDSDCFYNTDPHWRQEKIKSAAQRISEGLGFKLENEYEIKKLDVDYLGTYAGQSALPLRTESILYIENDMLSNCQVTNYETNTVQGIYDLKRGNGRDPYEFFLSGPVSLLKIDNPMGPSDKKLIIFRDSYASAVAPYLLESYSQVVLIDIRYIAMQLIGKFVDFNNSDVLFLYSSSVLNSWS
ncbi:MAG: hypothetical protein MJ123_03445 [Lachnospiraceae bacterium]|nr:hypothetical protein [Lachnospiraceae bacterium]